MPRLKSLYSGRHPRERALQKRIVDAGQAYCWRCGYWIDPAQPWDLGHDDFDPDFYRGPEHRWCNRSAGARKGNSQRYGRKRSRDW